MSHLGEALGLMSEFAQNKVYRLFIIISPNRATQSCLLCLALIGLPPIVVTFTSDCHGSRSFHSEGVQQSAFASSALSPSLASAAFRPGACFESPHIRVVRDARDARDFEDWNEARVAVLLEGWRSNILAFSRRVEVKSKGVNPRQVQRLIRLTRSRIEAVNLLHQKTGWSIRPNTLSVFIKKHDLAAPWRRQDPNVVEMIIHGTKSRGEAVELLQKELGWALKPDNLSVYMKRHGLSAPWQRIISRRSVVGDIKETPHPPKVYERQESATIRRSRDPAAVQEIIRDTRNRSEAVEDLQRKMGWTLKLVSLSVYMKRHGLTAPWQHNVRRSESGIKSEEQK